MRDAALRIADELPDEPTADDLREQEVEEARELLRWLADDHFTFLGYREYPESTARTTRWPPCPAPASASCAPTRTRARTTVSPSFGSCPPTPAPRPASTSCWC